MSIKIKSVYEKPEKTDGFRVLVDRLWPRGLTKEEVAADTWLKEIAPSTELRKWFSHDPDKWPEFRKRYLGELKENKESVSTLKDYIKKGDLTLLYGARDQVHNEALVIKDFIS